jgi:hypothetical protein
MLGLLQLGLCLLNVLSQAHSPQFSVMVMAAVSGTVIMLKSTSPGSPVMMRLMILSLSGLAEQILDQVLTPVAGLPDVAHSPLVSAWPVVNDTLATGYDQVLVVVMACELKSCVYH